MSCTRIVKISGGGSRVVLGGGGSRTIALDQRTVAQINRASARTVVQPDTTPVNVSQKPTNVVVGSSMGMQGPKGEPGGSIPAIGFSYGDAPGVVWTADAAGILTYARIKITAAFDSLGASVMVGTIVDPEAVLPAAYVLPQVADEYENTPDIRLSAGDTICIAITPAGSTAGAGLLFLTFTPD